MVCHGLQVMYVEELKPIQPGSRINDFFDCNL